MRNISFLISYIYQELARYIQSINMIEHEEKVALLEELHRPLEEHWSVKTNYGLDAKASDYIYKHHITRLEDIYVNHKTEYKNPPQLLFMSPVSQLYGVNGLSSNAPGQEAKLKKREKKWVSNFQTYTSLNPEAYDDQRGGTAGPSSRTRVKSPAVERTTSRQFSPKRKRNESDAHDESHDTHIKHTRRRCFDANMTSEDLVMLGMYRLNKEQEEIYRKFVEMVSDMDDYDKVGILEDAARDAETDDILDLYGGTALPPAAPVTLSHLHTQQRASSAQDTSSMNNGNSSSKFQQQTRPFSGIGSGSSTNNDSGRNTEHSSNGNPNAKHVQINAPIQ